MQVDPPQKMTFNKLLNNDRAFTDWNSFQEYTVKLSALNDFLDKKDQVARRVKYKEELDSLIKFKNSKDTNEKSKKAEELQKKRDDIKKSEEYDCQLHKQLIEFEKKRQETCLKEIQNKEENLRKLNKQELDNRAKELEENQKMIDLTEQQKKAHKAKIAQEFRECYQKEKDHKQAVKKQEKEDDVKFSLSEQHLLQKAEEKNTEFLNKLKNGWRRNDEIVALYEKLYKDSEDRRKAMEYQTIERPFLEKLRKDLEKEENELKIRTEIKKEKNEFILKQIEQNRIKKRLLKLEEAILDNEKLQKDLEAKHVADKSFKEGYRAKLAENLRILTQQIEEQRKALAPNHSMNQAEADMNNMAPVRVDYIRPNEDIIGGLPGIGISHDRKHQLDTLDKDLLLTELALTKPNAFTTNDRVNDPHGTVAMTKILNEMKSMKLTDNHEYSRMNPERRLSVLAETAQRNQMERLTASEPGKEMGKSFKNEYDLIRHKNRTNKFNIISNQVTNNY